MGVNYNVFINLLLRDKASAGIKRVAAQTAILDKNTNSVVASNKRMEKGFRSSRLAAGGLAHGIVGLNRGFGGLAQSLAFTIGGFGSFKAAAALAGTVVAGLSVKLYSDLVESTNAVQVVFGQTSERVLEFGRNAIDTAGLSRKAFQDFIPMVGALVQEFGRDLGDTTDLTLQLAQRAADMASVFNTSVADALSAVQQGLRGEERGMRRYAVDVTDATLKAYALTKGITSSVAAMDQQTKGALRLQLILDRTARYAGDFARTKHELANAMRRAKQEGIELATMFGGLFYKNVRGGTNILVDMLRTAREAAEGWERLGNAVKYVRDNLPGGEGGYKPEYGGQERGWWEGILPDLSGSMSKTFSTELVLQFRGLREILKGTGLIEYFEELGETANRAAGSGRKFHRVYGEIRAEMEKFNDRINTMDLDPALNEIDEMRIHFKAFGNEVKSADDELAHVDYAAIRKAEREAKKLADQIERLQRLSALKRFQYEINVRLTGDTGAMAYLEGGDMPFTAEPFARGRAAANRSLRMSQEEILLQSADPFSGRNINQHTGDPRNIGGGGRTGSKPVESAAQTLALVGRTINEYRTLYSNVTQAEDRLQDRQTLHAERMKGYRQERLMIERKIRDEIMAAIEVQQAEEARKLGLQLDKNLANEKLQLALKLQSGQIDRDAYNEKMAEFRETQFAEREIISARIDLGRIEADMIKTAHGEQLHDIQIRMEKEQDAFAIAEKSLQAEVNYHKLILAEIDNEIAALKAREDVTLAGLRRELELEKEITRERSKRGASGTGTQGAGDAVEEAQVAMSRGLGPKGGAVNLYIDGKKIAEATTDAQTDRGNYFN